MAEPPDFEPYQALHRLESDPSSELYLARHRSLERQVWIKALRPNVPLSSPFAARLEREAHVLSRLAHPNVINIIDCVRRPPHLWLVLEAVDGWSLSELLEALRRSSGRLDTRGAVALGLQLARALGHVHEAGFVHAAVLPRNILISKQGQLKLTGFSMTESLGTDAPAEPPQSEPLAFDGDYSSPEQILGEHLDEHSDVFSLGIVLHELVSGRHPFAGGPSLTTQNIRHASPEPLAQNNREVSPELERIIARCLEKQRERRFDGMGPLARALENVLGTQALGDLEPIVARALGQAGLAVPSSAPGPRTRADEIRSREAARGLRRSLALLLGACALTFAGGAALYAWVESTRMPAHASVSLLRPAERAELLVVADPWAHVFVDGSLVETTPFATPIQLEPGVHHVRLEHPAAPAERRRLDLAPGQHLVLEVAMRVSATRQADAGAHAGRASADAGAPAR